MTREARYKWRAEVREFLRHMRDSTNCICKGPIGGLVRDFNLGLRCIKCEATKLLKRERKEAR